VIIRAASAAQGEAIWMVPSLEGSL